MITKAYFIKQGNYVRYDAAADAADAGYPKPIAANWKGFAGNAFQNGLDAAVASGKGKVYMFRGAEYLRYDVAGNCVDVGYPLPIADHWTGFTDAGFDRDIDAAVDWGNGKIYFFKGDGYLRFDVAADAVDPGFPRLIADGWPDLASAGLGSDIDAIVNWGDGKAYFFKGSSYLRYDIAGDKVDEGYPMPTGAGWPTLATIGFAGGISAIWARDGAQQSVDLTYLSDDFFRSLRSVSTRLACDPADLLGVMESESSVQPWAQHPSSKATGLIQFMPAILAGLGWKDGPDRFKALTADQQLPFVEKFFAPNARFGLSSAGRLYQATFLPATLPGSSESTVIAAPGGPHADAYRDNRGLDMDNDGEIRVSDLTARIDAVRRGSRWASLMSRLNAV